MFDNYNYISMVVLLIILVLLAIVKNQKNKMGKMKEKIIETKIVIIFALNIVIIINLVQDYENLKAIHILIFSVFIILNNIYFIFFYNNIREKGLVINHKKVLWEDIQKIKKTNYSIEVIYRKNKKINIDIFNFDSKFLEKELNKREIPIEFPHRKWNC